MAEHEANEYVPVESTHGLLRSTYDSLDDLASAVTRISGITPETAPSESEATYYLSWQGGATTGEALTLARMGWDAVLTETLDLVESMVTKVDKAHDVDTFTPTWDVTGSDVDMGRYVSGEPENMISYPMVKTQRTQRMIQVCATVGARAQIGPEDMIRRGQIVTAFALIAQRLGYGCELWADSTAVHGGRGSRGDSMLSVRTMVKGPNDTIDPSRVLYAYAHPSMLRCLTFALRREIWDGGVGGTISPHHDMPDGTIYMDYHNDYDMDAELRRMLAEAGLLVGEG
jgi:hypothetical protein